MTEPWGNSPRRIDVDFVERINALAAGPEAPARFRSALTEGGGDLRRSLESLVEGEVPEHIGEYLDAFPQYEPIFLGVMTAVADRTARLTLSVEDRTRGDQLSVSTTDGVLSLAVRSM